MDPFIWHRNSLSLEHDHSYCRKKSQEVFNFVCIEPIFKPSALTSSECVLDCVDVEEDKHLELVSSKCHDDLQHFTLRSPTASALKNVASPTESSRCFWNIPTSMLFRRLKKMLSQCALENLTYKYKFSELSPSDCNFRRKSHHQLVVRRAARYTRKLFALLNWRVASCIELHENLLNCLQSDQLLLYLEGFANLLKNRRIDALISRLNADILARGEVTRFSYADFLDWANKSAYNSLGSSFSSRTIGNQVCQVNSNLVGRSASISFLSPPGDSSGCQTGIHSATAILKLDDNKDPMEPIFVCVLSGDARKGRLSHLLKCLSSSQCHFAGNGGGRVLLLDDQGSAEVEPEELRERNCLRLLNRRLLNLMEESKPAPVYLVGFGMACSLVLTAARQLPLQSGLEKVISGRLSGPENLTPSTPWLAGVICLGMPFTQKSDSFAVVARKCSLLLVVGERSHYGGEREARLFRAACIASRQKLANASVVDDHLPISPPLEFDLQLLVLGGADHLLRLHPTTAKRWSASQESLDSAIIVAIKNFVTVCRSLSNSNTSPSAIGTSGQNDFGMQLTLSAVGICGSPQNSPAVPLRRGTSKGYSIEARYRGAARSQYDQTSSAIGPIHSADKLKPEQTGFEVSPDEVRYQGHIKNPLGGCELAQESAAYYRIRPLPAQQKSEQLIRSSLPPKIGSLHAPRKTKHSPPSSPFHDPYMFEIDGSILEMESHLGSLKQSNSQSSLLDNSQDVKKIPKFASQSGHLF